MRLIHVCLSVSLLLLLAPVFTGCATNGRALNLVTTEQERQIGNQAAASVEEKERLLDDEAVQRYVAAIGTRLVQNAPRQDVTYTFKVIDAPDTVNAFALPGGYMYIYTGLMKICSNEAELAGVMAHEIAHVAAHHHGEAMTRRMGYQTVMQVALGQNPGGTRQLIAGLVGAGVESRFSQAQEHEADDLGMQILARSGYNPNAMADFMAKLLEQEGSGRNWLPIFASHPPTAERVARLRSSVSRYPAQGWEPLPYYEDRYKEWALDRLR
jgi:beta-barrel assembly-enhancing protease